MSNKKLDDLVQECERDGYPEFSEVMFLEFLNLNYKAKQLGVENLYDAHLQ